MNPEDPQEARRLLLEELSHAEYRSGDGFIAWVMALLDRWWTALTSGAAADSPAGIALMAAAAGLLVLGAVLLLRRGGWLHRSAAVAVSSALDSDEDIAPHELRARARTALEAGQHDEAVILALRAIVRDLAERTILDVPAGMTAQEAGEAIVRAFPDLRTPVRQTITAFDTAAYSRHSARQGQAHDALRLAEYIAGTSPRWDEATA